MFGISRPKTKGNAYVGVSGGVDSAVSAALLQKEGWHVTAVFIKIRIPGYPCPAAQDRIEAMRVAAHLGIPFLEVDLSREYEREVFAPSVEEFKKGRTPNPDTLCNEKIKFGVFFDFCMSRGADVVATGHYARLHSNDSAEKSRWGRPNLRSKFGDKDFSAESIVEQHLYVSTDPNKDQSYFLWAVPETALRHTMFPVGNLEKPQVRALAKQFGLPNAARHDSQGLCFLGDISIEDMLNREVQMVPGDVLSESGAIVGTHNGAALYTQGQRHGFTMFLPAGRQVPHTDAAPQYVVAKDISANTITVSPSKFPPDASNTTIALQDINWIGEVEDGECSARFRYRQTLIPAVLSREGNKTTVVLKEPHYVPLGQSLVLYRGERCLGGGVIEDATIGK